MREPTMADNQGSDLAQVVISGTLLFQADANRAPSHEIIARTEVVVNGQQIPIIASGTLAEELSSHPRGAQVAILGALESTSRIIKKKQVSSLQVRVEKVTLCRKPQISFGDSVKRKN